MEANAMRKLRSDGYA
ncbi:hypothetical protein Syncc8109_0604 [Synechococcus sp. WH 8109]|nr:hypothetical protein Syncc8109_0604 [Synechococcus sp. WH 8109]